MIDGSSGVVLSDTVPDTDPPCPNFPAVALDPDTGLPVAYFTPDDGWSAVAGGAGGVEVYKGTTNPTAAIGDPGVSTAVFYETDTPDVSQPTKGPHSLWVWDDGGSAWVPYPRVIHCSIAAPAGQTFADSTPTVFTTGAENWDTAGMHTGSTGLITIPYAGIYECKGLVFWSAPAAANGTRQLQIRKNGATNLEVGEIKGAASAIRQLFNRDFQFAAGDTVQARATQNSGNSGGLNAQLLDLTVRLIQPL